MLEFLRGHRGIHWSGQGIDKAVDRRSVGHYVGRVIWNIDNALLSLDGLLLGSSAVAC
jgi:hypothetical protein